MLKEIGVPYGNRTRVAAVKGRCPRPLDERDAWEGLTSVSGLRYRKGFTTVKRSVAGNTDPAFWFVCWTCIIYPPR
jgi:hypothetical protein